jgi:dTDP-4-amino-4,6-dideoxygalactose transaminase
MHQQSVFRDAPATLTGVADRLFATGLALPSGSGLGPEDIDRILTALRHLLSGARR